MLARPGCSTPDRAVDRAAGGTIERALDHVKATGHVAKLCRDLGLDWRTGTEP